MIVGQAGEAIAAQPIGARVADVQHVRDAPAQHQRREGASHPHQLGVALTLGLDPAIECVQYPGRRASHLHRFGQIEKSIQKTAHRGLGRHAAALCAPNSVGDRRDNVPARFRQLEAENGAGEILVAFARSGLRGEPHACLNAGYPLNHHRRSDFRWAAGNPGS
jgi:hypothetical protein